MFLFTLLSEADTVKSLLTIAIVLIVAICAVFLTAKKDSWNSKIIVYAAIAIGISFVLSFIQLKMGYGGSVTFASFVPILLFSYFYGFRKGLLVGVVYGFLQYIQGPYFINVWQFLFDYVFAFTSISLVSIFKKNLPQTSALIVGTILVGFVRLAMHTCAGFFFFNADWVVTLPIFGDLNAPFIYSLCYNMIYVVLDIAICIIVLFYLCKSKTVERLFALFQK